MPLNPVRLCSVIQIFNQSGFSNWTAVAKKFGATLVRALNFLRNVTCGLGGGLGTAELFEGYQRTGPWVVEPWTLAAATHVGGIISCDGPVASRRSLLQEIAVCMPAGRRHRARNCSAEEWSQPIATTPINPLALTPTQANCPALIGNAESGAALGVA
jgi:hypothetical protein